MSVCCLVHVMTVKGREVKPLGTENEIGRRDKKIEGIDEVE